MIRSSKPIRAMISRTALGVALAVGVVAGTALFADPAMAQRGKGKAPALKLSPEFQKLAAPLQTKLEQAKGRSDVTAAQNNPQALASALATEKAELDQLFGAIANEDDRLVAGQFAVTLGGLAQDPAIQRRGIDAMLQSGKAPESDIARLTFFSGQLAFQAKDYAAARTQLQKAIDAGFRDNDAEMLLAEAYIADNQTAQGLTMLQRAVEQKQAAGQQVPDSWYKRGLSAAYRAKALEPATVFGAGLVKGYPTTENWGAAITIVRELGRFPAQDMVDLLRLMGRTNSYAEARDYIEYIEAADARRLPGEVMKIIEAGTSSGKLPASDTTVAEARTIASQRLAADKASLPGLERDARAASATAVTTLASGDAFLSHGEAAKAEELYQIALGKSGVDAPRALTRLGIAQVDQGKFAEAQATFGKISGPRKPIADLWAAYAASKAQPTG